MAPPLRIDSGPPPRQREAARIPVPTGGTSNLSSAAISPCPCQHEFRRSLGGPGWLAVCSSTSMTSARKSGCHGLAMAGSSRKNKVAACQDRDWLPSPGKGLRQFPTRTHRRTDQARRAGMVSLTSAFGGSPSRVTLSAPESAARPDWATGGDQASGRTLPRARHLVPKRTTRLWSSLKRASAVQTVNG